MTAYAVTIIILVCSATLVGLALNFQWGLSGLVNFGVVGFVALGAYTTALLAPVIGPIPAMLAGAGVCAVLSMGLALVSARLEENYLAIVTIGFGEIVRLVLLNEAWLTGGALGISGIPRPFEAWIPSAGREMGFLVFAVFVVAIVFLALEALVRSPFGRVLRSIRDDAIAAAALGKPVLALRIRAFAVGGAVMGLAGALHAFYLTYIDPSQFTPIVTAYAFMAVIAGGRGSNTGLVLGAGSIMVLLEGTRFLKDALPQIDGAQLAALRLGLIGVGIVLLLILQPQGLMREPRRRAAEFFQMTRTPGHDAPSVHFVHNLAGSAPSLGPARSPTEPLQSAAFRVPSRFVDVRHSFHPHSRQLEIGKLACHHHHSCLVARSLPVWRAPPWRDLPAVRPWPNPPMFRSAWCSHSPVPPALTDQI